MSGFIRTTEQAMAHLMRRKTPDDRARLDQLCKRKESRRRARRHYPNKPEELFADLPEATRWLAIRYLRTYLARPKNHDATKPGKGWKFAALCGAARQQAMWKVAHPNTKFGHGKLAKQRASNRAKRLLGLLPSTPYAPTEKPLDKQSPLSVHDSREGATDVP